MDADKRHELKSNELAEALTKLRHLGSDRQTVYWLVGLLVVIVAFAGYRYWSRARLALVSDAWAKLAEYEQRLEADPEGAIGSLRRLGDESTNPTVAAAARLRAAAALREQAVAQPERQEALLQESLAPLRKLIDDPAMPAPLVAAGLFSLGTSYESLRQFDQAAEAYQRITTEPRFAGTPVREEAADRLATLDELRTPVVFVPGVPPPPSTQRVVTPSRVFPQTQAAATLPGVVPVPPAPEPSADPQAAPASPPPQAPPVTQPSGEPPPASTP